MTPQKESIKVLVVVCLNMGASHAIAYQNTGGFEICGIVSIGKSKEVLNERGTSKSEGQSDFCIRGGCLINHFKVAR